MRQIILLAFFLLSHAVYAVDASLVYNRVHLTSSASIDVENDVQVANMYAERQQETAAGAAQEVNKAIAWALKNAEEQPDIKVRTLDYQTNPVYESRQANSGYTNKIIGWKASQSLRLESKDSVKLGKLLSLLQQQLAVRAINYEVSKASREQAVNKLVSAAIVSFKARALQITRAFDFESYRLVEVHVDSGQNVPPTPVYRGRMMASFDAPVAIKAGTSKVEIQVRGQVELK